MEFITKLIDSLDPLNVLGIVFWAIIGGLLLYISYKQQKDFLDALKGEDGNWSTMEMIVLLWMVLLPALVISEVAFGLEAGSNIWNMVDLIGSVIILGKSYVASQTAKKNE